MNSLSMFPEIISQLSSKTSHESSRDKLKFVKATQLPYEEVEKNQHDYLKKNLSESAYNALKQRVDELNQESRLCELILEVISYAEGQMDRHVTMFDDLLKTVNRVREMEYDGTNFKEQAIDKCSLLIYDSFSVLRSMRKHIIELAKTYHVPYFYDTDESTVRLRSSLLTTFKNLNIVMDDFAILSEALWFVRHYNYFGPSEETAQEPAANHQGSQQQNHHQTQGNETQGSHQQSHKEHDPKPRLTPNFENPPRQNSPPSGPAPTRGH